MPGRPRVYLLVVVLLGALLNAVSADAKTRNCTSAEKAAADKQLWLNARDKKLSIERVFPWGAPVPKGETGNDMLLV